jgi:hypothetical protein
VTRVHEASSPSYVHISARHRHMTCTANEPMNPK